MKNTAETKKYRSFGVSGKIINYVVARSIEDNDLTLNYAFNTHTQFPLIYHAVAVTTPQLSLQEFP